MLEIKYFHIEFLYKKLTQEQKNRVIELWISTGVLSQEIALQRVEEVSTLILYKNTLVGVTTIYEETILPKKEVYFFFRIFIKKDFRINDIIMKQATRINFLELKKLYSNKAEGLAVELENEKLAHLAKNKNYMSKHGYDLYGTTPRGLELWYVRFDNPKGIYI